MKYKSIRLGDYIERSTKNNKDERYGTELIVGVSNEGVFTSPKGNPEGVDLKPYKIVNDGAFVYNPSRLDLGSIAYRTEGMCIVSHLYIVFYLNDEGKKIIDPTYLFMYFRRQEFYREVRFRNFGSQRPEFNFNDMSEIIMPLPPLPVQQKYVAIYKAMIANQQSYERGLENLKLVCDAYIDQLKSKCPLITIGHFITQTDNRNTTNSPYHFKGLSMENYFIDSIANDVELDFTKYKIVEPNDLACVLMKVGRDCRLTVAKNDSNETYIISPAYYTFTLHNINPEYFMVNVNRFEFERRAWFFCDSSARGSLSWTAFCNLEIPDASTEEQRIVACLQIAYKKRFNINERLKAQIKDLCPILVKGAVEEGEKT